MARQKHQVLVRLAADIDNGAFKPGQRLGECDLAQRYQVSRTPIREALLVLATLGKVIRSPGRGCVVAGPANDDASEKS